MLDQHPLYTSQAMELEDVFSRNTQSMTPMEQISLECTLCQYSKESHSTKALLDDLRDPIRLSRCLSKLPPSKRSACIVGLILRATTVASKAELLMSLPGSQVSDVMEEMRELLEGARGCTLCKMDPKERILLLRRLLIKLARNTQMVPRSFVIRGVQLQDRDPVNGGGFADIFRASYGGQPVALKKLRDFIDRPISESEENEFRREALVTWSLDHPNVQPFLGIDQTTFFPLICIVSTWQQNGNILGWLKHLKTLGLPILVDECIKRILLGLCYLHKNGIIHGDLRGSNILIDGHCNPKLADFGLSTLHGAGFSTIGTRSGSGAPRFMAPETLEESAQTSLGSDIYAFGCVCIELHTLQHPFPNIASDFQVISAVLRGSRPTEPSETTNSLAGFWETLSQCWNRDPLTRPSAHSLASSLPLRSPALLAPNSASPLHVDWEASTSETPHSPTASRLSAEHHSHPNSTCTLDSCLVGFLDFNNPHGKSVHEIVERLTALGCPEEVAQFVQEGLVDRKPVDAVPHPQMATPENNKPDTSAAITTGVDLCHRAPMLGTTKRTAERAASLYDLGCRLRDLGKSKVALECYLQAAEIQRELSTAETNKLQPLLASSLDAASYCLGDLGEYESAAKYYVETVRLQRYLAREKPDEFSAPLALSLHNLAWCLSQSRQDGVVYYRQAADLWRDLSREKPGEFNAFLADTLYNLSLCLSQRGECRDAVVHNQQAVGLWRVLAREKPNVYHSPLASSLHNLASEFSHLGEWDAAVDCCRQAADIWQNLARRDPGEFNALLASSLYNLASYFAHLGQYKNAIAYGQQAIHLWRGLVGEKPDEFNAPLASSLHNLAWCFSQDGEWTYAVAYGLRAAGLWRVLARAKPEEFNTSLAWSLANLTGSSERLGLHQDVVKFGRKAAAIFRSLPQPQPGEVQGLASLLQLLGPSLVILGFVDEAIRVDQEAKKLEQSLNGALQ